MRTLPTSSLAGGLQMAIDGWLLEQAVPAFRLYRWQCPTLSLGFHQSRLEPHWIELAEAGVIDLVRRPSGGRAVLHAGDITYALVWPGAPAERKQAYALACGWMLDAFDQIGMPLQAGRQTASIQRSSCFATNTAADLVHACGAKRVGSAQLWRRGCLLQHGSILVDPPTELWCQVFEMAPPQLPRLQLEVGELELVLFNAALAVLPPAKVGGSVLQPLATDELTAITARSGDYEVTLAGGSPVASPDASIERTTWGKARPRG